MTTTESKPISVSAFLALRDARKAAEQDIARNPGVALNELTRLRAEHAEMVDFLRLLAEREVDAAARRSNLAGKDCGDTLSDAAHTLLAKVGAP